MISMYFIITARSSDENENWCDFAIFEITRKLVEELERRDAFVQASRKLDSEFYGMSFWDGNPTYFVYPDDDDLDDRTFELLENVSANDDFVVLDRLPESLKQYLDDDRLICEGGKVARTECGRQQFFSTSPGEFEWRHYLKHTSIVLRANPPKIENLRRALEDVTYGRPAKEIRVEWRGAMPVLRFG